MPATIAPPRSFIVGQILGPGHTWVGPDGSGRGGTVETLFAKQPRPTLYEDITPVGELVGLARRPVDGTVWAVCSSSLTAIDPSFPVLAAGWDGFVSGRSLRDALVRRLVLTDAATAGNGCPPAILTLQRGQPGRPAAWRDWPWFVLEEGYRRSFRFEHLELVDPVADELEVRAKARRARGRRATTVPRTSSTQYRANGRAAAPTIGGSPFDGPRTPEEQAKIRPPTRAEIDALGQPGTIHRR
jgi:hypothetical protein